MRIKFVIPLLVLLGSTISLMGQDSKYERLFPFDNEAFKERLKEYNLFEKDSLKQPKEVIVLGNKNKYSMRWFKVHEEDMAKMPNMPIKKDVKFTMRIKKYESQNPGSAQRKIIPLKDKKLAEPMKKPE